MTNITQIILPNQPQFDPLAAYYLLIKYGQEKFPGANTAKISVWSYTENPTAEQKKEWSQKGGVAIDVGEGEFDHHNKKGQTATSLVAQNLGIHNNPELQTLLEYAWEDDQHGLHNKYGELPYIIKSLYKSGKETGVVITLIITLLDALQAQEEHWFKEAKEEFSKAKIVTIKGRKKYKVAFLESDDADVSNYARQQENMDVVVQRNSSGHTHVFTKKTAYVILKPIAMAIRQRELELRNALPQKIPADLGRTGKHPLVPEWYYHGALNALLNGSFAIRETPPTKIPWDEIQKIVTQGLQK